MKLKFLAFMILYLTSIILISACSGTSRFGNNEGTGIKEKDNSYSETGEASFYADEFNGKKTASGEKYNMNSLTAAHPYLPFGTKLKVTNLKNKKSVLIRVNDRMPDYKGRIIDLSYRAAKEIDMINDGVQEVRIEIEK